MSHGTEGSSSSGLDERHSPRELEDSSMMFEMDDRFNYTMPASFGPNTYQVDPDLIHNLAVQDKQLREHVRNTVTDAFAAQDACTMDDETRESLMRQKRKEDAYKTALCDAWRTTQECTYGENCRFAHGTQELRLPAQPRGRSHPKYKTVLCDKFSVSGFCKYGSRCQFIHKITNPALLAQRPNLNGSLNASMMGTPSASSSRFPSRAGFNRARTPLQGNQSFNRPDHNMSMPVRRDLERAFDRAASTSSTGNSLSRAVERQLGSVQWFNYASRV